MTATSRSTARTLNDSGLRWEVLNHDVFPGATIVWLRMLPPADHLAAAFQTRDLLIEETGSVPRLRVTNPSARAVLLQADLIVDGGKQARVIERSVIVPAASTAEIPVRCVEAGRWRPRDARTAAHFAVTSPASILSREHLARLKQRRLQERKQYELDQGEVWNHVSAELGRTRCASPTQSYTACLDRREEEVASAKGFAVTPPPSANGLALLRSGGSIWIEALPSPAALLAVAPKLVGDLLADDTVPPDSRVRDPRAVAHEAVGAVARAALTSLDTFPNTLGVAYAIDVHALTGSALLESGRLAHLVATVTR